MQYPLSLLISGLLALATGLGAPEARSAAPGIQLPPETVTLRPSTLPGFPIASQKCAICHSADYIAYQPPGMNQVQWTAEVTKMHVTYGAPLDASEITQVGIYLTAAYGNAASIAQADALPRDGERISDGGAVTAVPPDVQTLLGKNACLSCHALQQKIVGPAYRDAAAKYRSDPAALTKIEASIRDGGVGRWGSVPMPPFPGLSASELKALAEFVFAQ